MKVNHSRNYYHMRKSFIAILDPTQPTNFVTPEPKVTNNMVINNVATLLEESSCEFSHRLCFS